MAKRLRRRYHMLIGCWMMISILILYTAACGQKTERSGVEGTVTVEREQLVQLDQSADSFYRLVRSGDLEKAIVHLNRLHRDMEQLPLTEVTSFEGRSELLQSIVRAKRHMADISPKSKAIMFSAAQVRLAIDSMTHSESTMWKSFGDDLKGDVERIRVHIRDRNKEETMQTFRKLNETFQMIRPAMYVQKEAWVIEKGNSFLVFFATELNKQTMNQSVFMKTLDEFELYLDELFSGSESTTTLPVTGADRPWLWTLGIASFILAALSLYTFRRYKYEQEHGVTPRSGGML